MSDININVGIVQHNPKIGDIVKNLEKIKKKYDTLKSKDVDLVVTPELSLLGYPPRDLLHRRNIIETEHKALKKVMHWTSDGPSIIIGHTSRSGDLGGPPLNNSATVFKDNEEIVTYNKQLLPTYDIFDEHRYFTAGNSSTCFNINNTNIGITICEDAWHNHRVTGQKRHKYNPIKEYKDVDLLVNLSASPFSVGKIYDRINRFGDHAKNVNAPFVFANQVGGNDDILFDGSSFLVDSNGDLSKILTFGQEDTEYINQYNNESYSIEISSENQVRNMLKLGVRDYVNKTGFSDVVIGLSGGIDSSVTANIAVEALGSDNVHGITLPSSVTSDQSIEDARKVAKKLNITFSEESISEINQNYADKLSSEFNDRLDKVTKENIHARVRGVYLMGIANQKNALVLTPDNKSEAAVGYCTLYGDTVGAIAPLGDCKKSMVYELAKSFNRNPPNDLDSPTIPSNIIEKPPTAELSEGQKDSEEIPPYNIIDSVVEEYVGSNKTAEEIADSINADFNIVQDVINRITGSEFKRKQTPPALRITSKAFDSGWRYPIVASYRSQFLE